MVRADLGTSLPTSTHKSTKH